MSFSFLMLPLVSCKLLLVIGIFRCLSFPFATVWWILYWQKQTCRNVLLNVSRGLKDWSDHLSILVKINNFQWYLWMWTKSIQTKRFASELTNIKWNGACNQVIQITFGNIYFYWLLWKCLIIKYHIFQCAVNKSRSHELMSASEWSLRGRA